MRDSPAPRLKSEPIDESHGGGSHSPSRTQAHGQLHRAVNVEASEASRLHTMIQDVTKATPLLLEEQQQTRGPPDDHAVDSTDSLLPHLHVDIVDLTPKPVNDGGVDGQEVLSHSTRSSHSTGTRFACQFRTSGSKRGHELVLKFDVHGNSTFQEMSRVEVLQLVQDAGKTPPPSVVSPPAAAAGRGPRSRTRSRCFDGAWDGAGRVVDVQRVHARDLRKLDNAFAVSNEPSIVLRRQAILVNADPVRAVIMRDVCLLFVPDGADSLLSLLRSTFHDVVRAHNNDDGPYELQALEALLSTLAQHFEADFCQRAPDITRTLDRLCQGHISAGELETLRGFKNTMDEFESQVDGVRRMLMELLDNDEDLQLLHLTKLHEDPTLLQDLYSFDAEAAEVLIENYLQDVFSTRTKASLLQHRIQNTESLVMLKLDWTRNYLLKVDVFFSLCAIGLAIGTYITGAFGMNLDSHIQTREGWFWTVFALTAAFFFMFAGGGVLYFKRKGVFQ